MSPGDLSVVIPAYNTAAMTLRCARAALDATLGEAEVIVVDDGSSDGSMELLEREVSQVRVVRLESNRGFSVAANRGVAVARGRFVLLLNSDAILAEPAVHALIAAFDDSRLGVAGAQLLDEDGTPQWSGGVTPTLPWIAGVVSGMGHLKSLLCRGRSEQPRTIDWVSGAAMAFRRQTWNDAGPFDERYLFYCQDLELCLRARASGWDVRLIPEARVIHARGSTIAGDTELRHDPEKLWHDLLEWGRGHYGQAWWVRARRLLIAVAWLRIVGRRLRSPLRRDATTAALIRAARRL